MKVISFNINSLRARPHQLEAIIHKHDPDVITLQETKVHDDDFPHSMIESTGYHVIYHGQKGHYGVATLSKKSPLSFEKGFPNDSNDAQKRVIITEHSCHDGSIFIFNGYFPQGDSLHNTIKFPAKEKFYTDLNTYLSSKVHDAYWLLTGDFNISRENKDIGIGEKNAKRWLKTGKCSFQPIERTWLERIIDLGFYDTFRKYYSEKHDVFSWFDYRSRGFNDEPKRGLRIDLILANDFLYQKCIIVGIDYTIRSMEKASDLCRVWAEFSI
jgi:exodeoxyribonuclease-3